MAANFEKSGDFYQAAIFYEAAFAAKSTKKEYIYKAGNCYFKLRDYANASKCLKNVQDANDKYDKPGYKYALSSKQNGQHNEASKAFQAFNTYLASSKVKD